MVGEAALEKRVQREDYPWWVKVAIWGLPSRAGVWVCVWLSVLLALACGIYGFWDRRFFAGLLWLLAGLWYWLAIRWVDRNGSW
jgi:hypothetical protein